MGAPAGHDAVPETGITVRYWASARAAAGLPEELIATEEPLSVSDVRARALARHPEAERLPAVLQVCSVLIDDEPLGTRNPADVLVKPGTTLEFLPPFAGG